MQSARRAGATVYSLVLELADTELAAWGADDRIGAWAVASLGTDAGGWRSINRADLPMLPPLFTQHNATTRRCPQRRHPWLGPRQLRRSGGWADRGVLRGYGTAEDPDA